MKESTEEQVEAAAQALKAGQAVVFPTDTVYGVGVSMRDAPSPEAIYRIKERDRKKPIAWLVDGPGALDTYGKLVPESVYVLARTFWPGPLTIVVRASDAVPQAFRSNQGTVGLRMPCDPMALDLIKRVGCPLVTSSANLAGNPSVYQADELDPVVLDRVAAVLYDSDEGKSGVSSTVVDCSSGHPVILREGAISIADIMALW